MAKLVAAKREFKFPFLYYYGIFEIRISKFRRKDVIIPKDEVSALFEWARSFRNISRQDIRIYYYSGGEITEYDNIYPTREVRADGRLEIPPRITRKYNLREQVERGIRTIRVAVRLLIYAESYEATAYLPYVKSKKGSLEYKITKWFWIDFPYRSDDEKYQKIQTALRRGTKKWKLLYRLWKKVFWFIKLPNLKNRITIGITNRYKNARVNIDMVKALIIDLNKGIILYERCATKEKILKAKDGWKALSDEACDSYPECRYNIFLDIDWRILNKYTTIDDYLKYLRNRLNELGVRYNGILIILSSRKFLLYNYHIIVFTNLDLEEWLRVCDNFDEDEKHKYFHKIQKFSVLRIGEKHGMYPEVIRYES